MISFLLMLLCLALAFKLFWGISAILLTWIIIPALAALLPILLGVVGVVWLFARKAVKRHGSDSRDCP